MELSASDIDDIVTKRRDFLSTLRDGSATKPELVDRLETSRSTVDRAIDDLERYDLVRRPDDSYELTMAGKAAYERHRNYLDELSAIGQAREIIASLSPEVPFSHDLLADAKIELAEAHDPHQPIELAGEIISDATRLRKVSPAIFPICVDVLKKRAVNGLSLGLVVPSDVLEAMASRYSDEIQCLDRDEHQLYELTETPPYGLWVADTPDGQHVGLMPTSDTGVRGLIVTDDDDACRWALDQYEQYRERGTPVTRLHDRA